MNNNDLTPGQQPYPNSSIWTWGAERIWVQQEMTKGGYSPAGDIVGFLNDEKQGGWEFNEEWGTRVWVPGIETNGTYVYVPLSTVEANVILPEELRSKPFFKHFDKMALMHGDAGVGSSGSEAADEATIADLLGGAIPALSFPAGRNPVPVFGSLRNRDLMGMKDGWPAGRPNTRWLHSDIRDVAYFFNYGAWDFFTTEGNLR